jgi:hypothetical protein
MMFSRFNFFEWFMKTGYPTDKYRLSVATHTNETRLLLVSLALARKRYLEITLSKFCKCDSGLAQAAPLPPKNCSALVRMAQGDNVSLN